MQRKDRRSVFRRRYNVFIILGVLLFIGMIVQSIVTKTDPSPRWLIPSGILFVTIGVHFIVYKDEASDMAQEQYNSFWKRFPGASFYYDPVLIAGMGVVSCLIGFLHLIKGILG